MQHGLGTIFHLILLICPERSAHTFFRRAVIQRSAFCDEGSPDYGTQKTKDRIMILVKETRISRKEEK